MRLWRRAVALVLTLSALGLAARGLYRQDLDADEPELEVGIATIADSKGNPVRRATAEKKLTVRGKATPQALVRLFVDGSEAGSTLAADNGDWSVAASRLSVGPHVIKATAFGCEETAEAERAVTVDVTPPDAPTQLVLDPASDSGAKDGNLTHAGTPTIVGRAEPGSTVEVFSHRAGSLGLGRAHATTGQWSLTSTRRLDDGEHRITAKATDEAGNPGPESAHLAVNIDTRPPKPPSAPTLDPASNTESKDDTLTKITAPAFVVVSTDPDVAMVQVFADGVLVGSDDTAEAANRFAVTPSRPLPDGTFQITAQAIDKAGNRSGSSAPLTVTIDTRAPKADRVDLVGAVGGTAVLQVRFEHADLSPASVAAANFRITRSAGSSAFSQELDFAGGSPTLAPDGRTVQIPLSKLVTDRYQVLIAPKEVAGAARLRDLAGNEIAEQRLYFSSLPERERGEHVEFPQYVPRPKRTEGEEFNPGDKVETRVARLYYYRDAHRVAEIINRNVKSYNRAAVDQKRREAEAARSRADELTDQRRHEEREAVVAAQETRRLERELNELPAKLSAAADQEAKLGKVHQDARAEREAKSTTVTVAEREAADAKRTLDEKAAAVAEKKKASPPDPQAIAAAEREADTAKAAWIQQSDALAELKSDLAAATERESRASRELELVRTKRDELLRRREELTDEIPRVRQREIAAREEMDQAQAAEDRAREDQFRKEVAAAHEDPDTYVPGKVDSIDAVTQVSISVIGEGLIQLRGPIRGINKIRTMIDQIDTPVGQVKVGIFTIQVNGEHGDRMERVAQRIEGHVDVSRFLTAQSMMLLRRSVQEVAAQIAEESVPGHYQVDRDRRYLYAFFGRDFIDELYAMDSEFLQTGNKVLSLHSMDTVSRSAALFVMALAKNDVRQRILARFMQHVECELPEMEYDFRKASGVLLCHRKTLPDIVEHAYEHYRFRSLRGMFDLPLGVDTLTPMQREFIRLAQIFKSQMVAEVELKQRVIERALIEDRANDEDLRFELLKDVHRHALVGVADAASQRVNIELKLTGLSREFIQKITAINDRVQEIRAYVGRGAPRSAVADVAAAAAPAQEPRTPSLAAIVTQEERKVRELVEKAAALPPQGGSIVVDSKQLTVTPHPQTLGDFVVEGLDQEWLKALNRLFEDVQQIKQYANPQQAAALTEALEPYQRLRSEPKLRGGGLYELQGALVEARDTVQTMTLDEAARSLVQVASAVAATEIDSRKRILLLADQAREAVSNPQSTSIQVICAFEALIAGINELEPTDRAPLLATAQAIYAAVLEARHFPTVQRRSEDVAKLTRQRLDHRKLLDHLIDEHEEKYIELKEGTKSHLATMDNYLKRLAIALEDDFKVQFYDPAFAEIRKAAREWDVNLGQVERTTILTNNRAFAKVSPQATMEFDLPKRDILIQEAMKGAKAMVEDYGALMQDPTFLAAAKMLSGSPTSSASSLPRGGVRGLPSAGQASPGVKSVLPGLPSQTEEQVLNQSGNQERELGAALEALIPDPAIYKFETGTGFEIRPVIQPDGDSIIYDFNYMYTTNVREPVRADEKHLGRVKRHFIDTQVQTSSFELREISRYQVALKASRTSRGVPLFEDIPGLGILFRPLPSAESALQQNIILGQSTVYPTLFDLMGLRWAPHVVDLDHDTLRDAEHIIRGRRQTISDFVFGEASDRVDEFLDIDKRGLLRPDLYHRQTRPSPYHPGGYDHSGIVDPTRRGFRVPDRRPPEMRQPLYDDRGRLVPSPESGLPPGQYYEYDRREYPQREYLYPDPVPPPNNGSPHVPPLPRDGYHVPDSGRYETSSSPAGPSQSGGPALTPRTLQPDVRQAKSHNNKQSRAQPPAAQDAPVFVAERVQPASPAVAPNRLPQRRGLLERLPLGRGTDK
jgi:hypothetical protein